MKTALVLLISCAGLSLAQNTDATPKPVVVKKLASVTWDLATHKLVWVVQKGYEQNGEFIVATSDKYEVSPEEGSMALKDEKRGLGEEEASSVTDLVNLLSLYCAESTDWWEDSATATDAAAPAQSPKSPDANTDSKKAVPPSEKPTRVGSPDQRQPVHLPGTLVAENSGANK